MPLSAAKIRRSKRQNEKSFVVYYTFVEGYDFSGKTIVPFATLVSSGIGDSGKNLAEIAKEAKVEEGKRFPASASADELKTWADAWLWEDIH